MSTNDGEDPELEAAMRRAVAYGFHFTRPRPDAPWWAERETDRWRDVVYLDPAGPCNAARCRRAPGGVLFVERVSGDAVAVLRTVCQDWPI